VAQQILGQQDADDVVAVAVVYGKTRVCGFDHMRDEHFGRVVDVDDVHLRARNHDFADAHFGYLQHAFDHRQRVGVHQTVFVGAVQQFNQLLAVFGLTHQPVGNAFEQARLVTTVGLHFLRQVDK